MLEDSVLGGGTQCLVRGLGAGAGPGARTLSGRGRGRGRIGGFGLGLGDPFEQLPRQVVADVAAPQASAPPTISMISVVMASWRAWFISRERLVISSSALSVAAFMARWRLACSEAAASSSAP